MDQSNPIRSINSDFSFSLYPNILTVDEPIDQMDVNHLYETIKYGYLGNIIKDLRKSPSKEKYNATKRKKIPCVTLSGTFNHRSSKGFIKHSGLIQIDLDNVPDINDAFKKLCHDDYTYLCFTSPGGKGLKVIVKINPSIDTHRQQFLALERYFKEKMGLTLDSACKDIARPMLLSYDPSIFCKPHSDVFEELFVPDLESKKIEDCQVEYKTKVEYSENSEEFIERIINKLEQEGIDITRDYLDWIRIAYSLDNTFGENGIKYFHRISSLYPGYKFEEADTKYKQLSYNNTGKITIATLIYLVKIAGIDVSKNKTPQSSIGSLPSGTSKRKAPVPIKKDAPNKNGDHSDRTKEEREIYEDLIELRKNLVKKVHVKPFMVFYNQTLLDIVKMKPRTKEQLLMIKHIGKGKFDWYGQNVIDIIDKHIQ